MVRLLPPVQVQQRAVEQSEKVPSLQNVEAIVKVVKSVGQGRIYEKMREQIVDAPASQVVERGKEPLVSQERVHMDRLASDECACFHTCGRNLSMRCASNFERVVEVSASECVPFWKIVGVPMHQFGEPLAVARSFCMRGRQSASLKCWRACAVNSGTSGNIIPEERQSEAPFGTGTPSTLVTVCGNIGERCQGSFGTSL